MSFQFRTDSAAAWSAADPVLGPGELGLEYDSGKFKVGDGVTRWQSLAYVISAPAQVVSEEKARGSQTELRSFSPADVREMVVTFAPPAPVSSVAGKTGAVSLTKADMGLAAVTNDAQLRADLAYPVKSAPTAGDKLIIKDTADGLPRLVDIAQLPISPQVNATEKTAGTCAAVRTFAPIDVRDMVVTFAPPAPVSSVAGKTGAVSLTRADVGLAAVTNDPQLRGDLLYPVKSSPTSGDKLIIKDTADGLPKLVDLAALPLRPASVTSSEKTTGTSTNLRSFAPADVRDMVVTFAPPPPVTSVAGKSGAVSLTKGDVGLAAVTNDPQLRADFGYASKAAPVYGDKFIIKDAVDGQPKLVDICNLPMPAQVSAVEKTSGNSTTVRSFSPADVRDMAATFAPPAPVWSVAGKTGAVSLNKADVGLAAVTNDVQLRADFGYTSKASPAGGDQLVIKDRSDGQPKTIDWSQLPAQPVQVSSSEKLDGTLTSVRGFSPSDVRDIVQTFAPLPPAVTDAEKAQASLTSVRAFSPKDIADMISALANPRRIDGGTATTVFS